MRVNKVISTVLLSSALVVGASACGTAEAEDSGPDTNMAAVMCEEFVKRDLKSPGSAEFNTDPKTTVVDETTVKVDGHVDSQNSFGASVRSRYVCTIANESGDKWTLKKLDLA